MYCEGSFAMSFFFSFFKEIVLLAVPCLVPRGCSVKEAWRENRGARFDGSVILREGVRLNLVPRANSAFKMAGGEGGDFESGEGPGDEVGVRLFVRIDPTTPSGPRIINPIAQSKRL